MKMPHAPDLHDPEQKVVLLNRCRFVLTTFAYLWIATCVILAGRSVFWTVCILAGAALLFSKSLIGDSYTAAERYQRVHKDPPRRAL